MPEVNTPATAQQLYEEYFDWLTKTSVVSSTIRNYCVDIAQLLQLAGYTADTAISDYDSLSHKLIDIDFAPLSFTTSTVNRKQTALRHFISFLEGTQRLHIPQVVPKNKATTRKYKRIERDTFMDFLDHAAQKLPYGRRTATAFGLLYCDGLTVGEVSGLRTDNVELYLDIPLIAVEGNNKGRVMGVDIITEVLMKFYEDDIDSGCFKHFDPHHREFYFATENGGQLTGHQIRRYFRQATSSLGVEYAISDLRANYAHNRMSAGFSPRVIGMEMGISSAQVRSYLNNME